jgi:AsmA protein
MKKLLKVLAGLVGVAVLLVVAAIIAAPFLFDPNDQKPRIEALVKSKTGRDFSIQGDVSLSLFPWLGVNVGRLTLGNAPGFEAKTFAEVEAMEVRVKLVPLIKKQVEMDTVAVDGLTLHLARKASGASNWDDLVSLIEKPPAGAAERPPLIAALAIGGVNLSNAGVTIDDEQSGQKLRVANLKLTTGPVSLDAPVAVTTEFDFSGGPPETSGHVSASSDIALDLGAKRYIAQGFQLVLAIDGAVVPGGKAKLEAKGNASFDETAQRLEITGLELRSDNPAIPGVSGTLALSGDLSALLATQEINADNIKLSGELSGLVPEGQARFEVSGSARANLRSRAVVAPDLQVRVPSLAMRGLSGSVNLKSALAGNLDARRFEFTGLDARGQLAGDALAVEGEVPFHLASKSLALDLVRQTAALDAFTLDALEAKAAGSLAATSLLSAPRLTGKLEVAPFDLRRMLAKLGQPAPQTADEKTLTTASLNTSFAGGLDGVTLKPFSATVDDTQVSGSLELGQGATAPVRFDLRLNGLDADRYLPPREAGKTPPATPAAATAAAITLPVEQLRALDVQGRLRAARLKVSGLRLRDVDATLTARQGRILLSPLKAGLYGGRYAGGVSLDVRTDKPVVSLDERVSEVQMDALLKDLGVSPGNLDFSGAPSNIRLKAKASGDLARNVFRFSELSLGAALGGRSFPNRKLRFDLGGGGNFDLGKQTLTADPFTLKFGPLVARGKLAVAQLLEAPRYAATLDVPNFNARSLLKTLGQPAPKTADPRALTAVGLTTTVSGSAGAVSFDPLSLTVDGARIKGRLALSNFEAKVPAARFDLKAGAVDADRYLPPRSAKPEAATAGAAMALLPVDTLRALDLDGRLEVAQLKFSNLRLNNVTLVAKGKDGLVSLHPLSAKLYRGAYSGNINVDARGKQPRLSLDERLTGIQVGPLLKDLRGSAPVTGRADLSARLTASGADQKALQRSANGNARFAVVDGTVKT